MTGNASTSNSDGFYVGNIVWARRDHDGIYWPGIINSISNNITDTSPTNSKPHYYRTCSYRIQLFGYNQTHGTNDVLSYRQYRDYMSTNLLSHYEPYPQIKYQLLDAIHQADNADMNEKTSTKKSTNTPALKVNYNYNYIPTSHSMMTDYTCRNWTSFTGNNYPYNQYSSASNSYPQYMSNSSFSTQSSGNNYCSCCMSSPSSAITSSLSQFNNDYQSIQNTTVTSQTEIFQKAYSVIIVTTKTYSTPSFISYLVNSLSHSIHHSIIYIDDDHSLPINNYHHHHSTTSTISYLVCLDHFDSHISQALDSTIFNHLTSHTNYLFLLLNVPSHDLVQHFYAKVTDQRTIAVLRYHSTFENETFLLYSGDRRTYEEIRSNLLRCLCSKVKYIESSENTNEQLSSNTAVSSNNQSNEIKSEPIVDISHQTLKADLYVNDSNNSKEYSTESPTPKHAKTLGQRKLLGTCARRILKHKSKQRLATPSSKYHVHNILDTVVHSSK